MFTISNKLNDSMGKAICIFDNLFLRAVLLRLVFIDCIPKCYNLLFFFSGWRRLPCHVIVLFPCPPAPGIIM